MAIILWALGAGVFMKLVTEAIFREGIYLEAAAIYALLMAGVFLGAAALYANGRFGRGGLNLLTGDRWLKRQLLIVLVAAFVAVQLSGWIGSERFFDRNLRIIHRDRFYFENLVLTLIIMGPALAHYVMSIVGIRMMERKLDEHAEKTFGKN